MKHGAVVAVCMDCCISGFPQKKNPRCNEITKPFTIRRFRIDAITIFAIPAAGPHGFHAIGRVIESTLRTANNLLERLHASFFFYIMTSSDTFLKIGAFLPSAVLVSVAMMFVGLGEWVRAGWVRGPDRVAEKAGSEVEWLKRRRPLMKPLGIVLGTHVFGAGVFGALNAFADHHSVSISFYHNNAPADYSIPV